jgi:hypothetical protein
MCDPMEGDEIIGAKLAAEVADRLAALIGAESGDEPTLQRRPAFQQAEKPDRRPQLLQKVATPGQAAKVAVVRAPADTDDLCLPKRQARPEPKLTRVAFKVSRLMEFCSRRELESQTAHSMFDWPLVVIKELADNGLDGCEEAEVAPEIAVTVKPHTIFVGDNGPGISGETIESILDYAIRASSREAYVSPTRGAQGNALKTILAMGYVLNREIAGAADAAGVTIIEARGVAHRIEFRVDHINSQPKIVHTRTPSEVEVGTKVTIVWPPTNLFEDGVADRVVGLVKAYAWFNPHLTVRGTWLGKPFVDLKATDPNWRKWRPSNPTSPHWYDEARLQRYLAAHVSRDRDLGQARTVREFIAEFRGLSGTALQRKILNEVVVRIRAWRAFSASRRSTAPESSSYWRR